MLQELWQYPDWSELVSQGSFPIATESQQSPPWQSSCDAQHVVRISSDVAKRGVTAYAIASAAMKSAERSFM
jgi:hypothetical protein